MRGGVADVINCAKVFENPSEGFGAVSPRKIAFPIESIHRPYNSVGTTVPHCDSYGVNCAAILKLCNSACVAYYRHYDPSSTELTWTVRCCCNLNDVAGCWVVSRETVSSIRELQHTKPPIKSSNQTLISLLCFI